MHGDPYLQAANRFFNKLPAWVYVLPYVLHAFATNRLLRKTGSVAKQPTLYDVIGSNTPDLSAYSGVHDIVAVIIGSFSIIPLFVRPQPAFFVSLFKYFSIITLLRTITTNVTVLPPLKTCKPSGRKAYLVGHCIDKIFSGHTAASFLFVLLYWRYHVVSKGWLVALMCLQVFMAF